MNRFAQLFRALDATTRTSEKVAALEAYFRTTPAADTAWVLHFLLGRRGRRPVKTSQLREWIAAETGLPGWLVEESYEAVGDLAETLTLLLEGRTPCRPAETSTGRSRREEAQTTELDLRTPSFAINQSLLTSAPTGDAAHAPGAAHGRPLHQLIESALLPLAGLPEAARRELLLTTLRTLDRTGRFLWLKLITGAFRLGVSRTLVIRGLAAATDLPRAVLEHRVMSDWRPTAADFERLISPVEGGRDPAQSYPFLLASPIAESAEPITDLAGWQTEWKWDGIRAQLIRRAGQTVLWSRGEEVITPGYPEIARAAEALPDGTVLDGELLAWSGERPLPFGALQKRLGRKRVPDKVRREVPVIFMAYDLLEIDGRDIRVEPLTRRRDLLEQVLASADNRFEEVLHGPPPRKAEHQGELFATLADGGFLSAAGNAEQGPAPGFSLRLSPLVPAQDMSELTAAHAESRARGTEGLMLKRRASVYGAGRTRGAWWKWKVDPYTIDAVLIAAQPGHGKRAGRFTDYTFALWEGSELVSCAKAYSGLRDDEVEAVDRFVRQHTLGRHGPVRRVKAELVFELAFEGLQASSRHKSGFALRFPRILRWRKDKPAAQADHLETLRALLPSRSNHSPPPFNAGWHARGATTPPPPDA
jgi:DNA ligase 1